jgi:hypothetical protein
MNYKIVTIVSGKALGTRAIIDVNVNVPAKLRTLSVACMFLVNL